MRIQAKSSEIGLVLIVSLMSFGANLPEHVLSGIVDQKVLLMALIASVVTALFRYLRFMSFMTVSILAVGANLPAELAHKLGIDPRILLFALAAMVTLSLLNYVLKVLPTGLERKKRIDTLHSRENLLAAVSRGDMAMVQRLLALNIEVNFQQHGGSPIFIAAEKGYADMVQILLHHGANFRVKNRDGRTPMDLALANGYTRTAQILHYATEAVVGKKPTKNDLSLALTNMYAQ
jgi:hypothetical protein